jgi:hypothetical protein
MESIPHADAVEVHYYPRDGSVFLDTHYLIKGVAGAIFWKLAREHARSGRREFSLRELRLAGHELRLPELQDNLSVRLLLLQRRLAERGAAMQLCKTGRGRFRIDLQRPLRLVEVPEPARTPDVPALRGRAEVGIDQPAGRPMAPLRALDENIRGHDSRPNTRVAQQQLVAGDQQQV